MRILPALRSLFTRTSTTERRALERAVAPLRERAAAAVAMERQLSGLPESSQAALRADLDVLEQSAPAPGSLWVEPSIMNSTLKDPAYAARFAAGPALTHPIDSVEGVWFSRRPLELRGADGTLHVLQDIGEYAKFVEAERRAAGMPVTDGTLQPVEMCFQGGGNLARRFPSVVEEAMAQGVVPTAFSGTSGGAFVAALLAAGAHPRQLEGLFDRLVGVVNQDLQSPFKGGLVKGARQYEILKEILKELTGFEDVTFGQLPARLRIYAAKTADSAPPAGADDFTNAANRTFVFSPETTRDTSVAGALATAMAIPGWNSASHMQDALTGRKVTLVDAGVINNYPVDLAPHDLFVVGLSATTPGALHPLEKKHTATPRPLPAGDLKAGSLLGNLRAALKIRSTNAVRATDFHKRTEPGPGELSIVLPTTTLDEPRLRDSFWRFRVKPPDERRDQQGREIARNLLRQTLHRLGDPTFSASNISTAVPAQLPFPRTVTAGGKRYEVTSGSRGLTFTPEDGGKARTVKRSQQQLEAMVIDANNFGHLDAALALLLRPREK